MRRTGTDIINAFISCTVKRPFYAGLGVALFSAVAMDLQAAASVYMKEAENAELSGQANFFRGPASNGEAVWLNSGSIRWRAAVEEASYRLFARVRSGWSGDRESGVRGDTQYRIEVDEEPVSLQLVPDTLAYPHGAYGDENNFAWLVSSALPLTQGLHTIDLRSDWHHARCDVFLLTPDPNFVPPVEPPFGEETPLDLSLVNDPQQRRQVQGFELWTSPSARNLPPTAEPTGPMLKAVEVNAARNEYKPAVFNVTNGLDEPLVLRIRIGPGSDGTSLDEEHLTLRFAVPLPCFGGEVLSDALVRPDSGGLLTIPALESRQVWLIANTHGLAPGLHTVTVHLVPAGRGKAFPPQILPYRLHISELDLPVSHPLSIFLFDYSEPPTAYLQDAPAHYVNVFHNTKLPSPDTPRFDYAQMDAEIERELGVGRMIFFENWDFRATDDWKEVAGRKRFIRWLTDWRRHVHEDLKLSHEEYCLHFFDEPSGPGIDDYIAARQLVESIDPEMRSLVTMSSSAPLDDARRMAEYVDIWAPYLPRLEDDEELAFYRSEGKPLWPYVCAENKKVWPPYERCRLLGWKVWKYECDGFMIWHYGGSETAWDGRTWDGGMIYPGDGDIAPSRRWEAFRDGLTDWLYLDAVRKAAKTAAARGDAEGAARAREEINAAVADVLDHPEELTRADEWRTRLVEVYRRLQLRAE